MHSLQAYVKELNWISLFKLSYVIMKLHNSSHLFNVCLNNANRPKPIITITIKKRIWILKRMSEQNHCPKLYVTNIHYWSNICKLWDS